MIFRKMILPGVALVTLLVMVGSAQAATFEVYGPIVIETPGTYVLQNDILDCNELDCIKIIVSDVIFDGNGYTVDGRDTGCYAFRVQNDTGDPLNNVQIKNLNLTDWRRGVYFNNVHNGRIEDIYAASNEYGIELSSSENNILTNNIIVDNTDYGLHIPSSGENLIYNNYFSNDDNVAWWINVGTNIWNVSQREGPNIIGGDYIAGNYWGTPAGDGYSQTCLDVDRNDICDEKFVINPYGDNFDFLPIGGFKPPLPGPVYGPQIIAYSGTYTLQNDIADCDWAQCFEIIASDVIFEGNGYTIDGIDWGSSAGFLVKDLDDEPLTNITIRNAVLTDWYRGIFCNDVHDGLIENIFASSNDYGVVLELASESITLKDSTIVNNRIYGLGIPSSGHNLIYNNYFNNSINAQSYSIFGSNTWNVSMTEGPNIIGGEYIGGNYWATPEGDGHSQINPDGNGDGFCDLEYDLMTLFTNIDWLPLTTTGVIQPPEANFTSNITSGKAPLTVSFSDTSTGEFIESWLWEFGDGFTSVDQDPIHTYVEPGNYSVNLTVTNSVDMYDSQIRENYITVEALVEPVADFSADVTTGKLPLTVTFIDNSIDAVSWAWDIDNDGVIDYTDQNPVHVYTDPGTYSVSLTVTSIDDVSVTILMENYITVEALVEPVADFSADVTTGKLPLTVTFIDNSIDAVSWAWDIDNDGVIDYTDQNPVHVYTDPGTYSVSLTVTSEDGLIDSLLREAYITVEQIDPPVADFEVSITTGIAPLTVQFTDCSAGSPTAWAWDFSDGATSDNQNPQHIYSDAGTFDVSLTVTNSGGSDSTTKTDYIIVTSPNSPPIADAGDSYTAPEGTAVTLDASGSSDPDGDDLQFRWDVDSDGEWETSWSANPEYSFTWEDDFSGMATVEVSDGELSATATADVSVSNEPPTFGAITAPVDPVQVDTAVSASAEWTDPGTLDTHTASWDWGDGTSSDGVVAGTEGSGTITGTHTYTVAGVYTITLKVTDDNGGAVLSVYQYVVIHDPDGGFVTGGGWIESPAGAYVADPDLTGKATFGFDSKYKKGANVPTGETEFQFQVADLNFHSDEYEWLVVAGAKAKYKGTGTISGEGSYKFMLSAVDADINKKDAFEIDRFRIKIWEKDELENEIIIYDNGLGADLEDDNALTEIGRGSIVIHTK
ncbi:hypothetical protein CUJ86_07470 [Methanofollis fontis]|uniref:PKD domain-containing protein n=2 Tax=Methanofollis fontis TaxID=2052832 RepID=A0A483CMQ1_9EURY|nr:hypothetical protein CUJ86_07470 [Methanofollis fontis]